jgi:AraC-like DNA-binding protein
MSRLDLIHDWLAKAAEAHYNARQLATLCDVSGRHLRRWFSQWTGDAVRPWLSEVQLWSSIPMLIDGRLIKEISSDLGFSSPVDFCIRFKRRFGVSPNRFLQDGGAVRRLVQARRSITPWPGNGPGRSIAQVQTRAVADLESWISVRPADVTTGNVRQVKQMSARSKQIELPQHRGLAKVGSTIHPVLPA